jgi:hypothetical protein
MGELVRVKVRRHATGRVVGQVRWGREKWVRYADGHEPGVQYPEGVARAGDVLDEATLEDFDLDDDTVIYFEEA